MGQDMTYTAKSKELSFRLSPTDIDLWNVLAKEGLKDEMEAVFGVSEYDSKTPIEKEFLLKSIDKILGSIENNPQMLPCVYYIKIETPPGSGMYSTGTGMASGIRINNELYSIEGGLNRCELTRMFQDESGKWHDDKPKDIREFKKIITDNHGEIVIRKRKKPTNLVRNLKKLRSFLQKIDVEEVQKILL